jgi:hypothetical protein
MANPSPAGGWPCASACWVSARKPWNRSSRCSTFGPSPTEAWQRRRSCRSEIPSVGQSAHDLSLEQGEPDRRRRRPGGQLPDDPGCPSQQLARLDGLVDELRCRKAKYGGGRARTETDPDDRRTRLQHLDQRPGLRTDHQRDRPDPKAQLDAPVRDGAMGVRRRVRRDPLHPNGGHQSRQRRDRPSLVVTLSSQGLNLSRHARHSPIVPTQRRGTN